MSGRLRPYMKDEGRRLELLRLVHSEARRAKLAPELVLSVIEVESRFDRYAVSSAGAQGLMQIMPFWLKEIGKPGDNLFHTRTNLRMGCTILKRSEEHTSELQSLMRISYAVFCLKKKQQHRHHKSQHIQK